MGDGAAGAAVATFSKPDQSASAAAYAAKAGLTCAVLVPKGKIAMGKMAQTLVHGARVLEVEGNFDDSLEEPVRDDGTGRVEAGRLAGCAGRQRSDAKVDTGRQMGRHQP